MKVKLLCAALFLVHLSFGQETPERLARRFMLKTNLTNVFARKPSFSIEKFLSPSVSVEAAFVQGRFENVLFTNHYHYSGGLLRIKKFDGDVKMQAVQGYWGGYAGLLKRFIYREKRYVINPIFSIADRLFTGNSFRFGGSVGGHYISKSRIIIDAQLSLGYGIYYKQIDLFDPASKSSGYLDMQTWISIGYCF